MSGTATYKVVVKTGDRRRAGTDANVNVIFHCDDGRRTNKHWLWHVFKDDFERGHTDKFSVRDAALSSLDTLEMWRDDCGLSSCWFVDTVDVWSDVTQCNFVFPIFRWIRPKYHYKIRHLDTSLPQNDPYRTQRDIELEEKKRLYEINVKVLSGLVASLNADIDGKPVLKVNRNGITTNTRHIKGDLNWADVPRPSTYTITRCT